MTEGESESGQESNSEAEPELTKHVGQDSRADVSERLVAQPIPSEARCPNPDCRAKPTTESIARQTLSDMGYLHHDVKFECRGCGEEWTAGIPIHDEDEQAALDAGSIPPEWKDSDLWCSVCDDAWRYVHRIRPHVTNDGEVVRATLHLKCPNDCKDFRRVTRDADEDGLILTGYPMLVGSTDGVQPYGYPADNPPKPGNS